MAMVGVDDSSLPADSQPKSVGLVWGLVAIWRSLHSSHEPGELLKRCYSAITAP